MPLSEAQRRLLEEAQSQLKNKDWNAARRAFQSFLGERPHHPEAWLGLARAERHVASVHDVQATLAQACAQVPRHAELFLADAEVAREIGDLVRVRTSAQVACKAAEDAAGTTYLRAVMLLSTAEQELGFPHRAHFLLRRAQHVAPRHREFFAEQLAEIPGGEPLTENGQAADGSQGVDGSVVQAARNFVAVYGEPGFFRDVAEVIVDLPSVGPDLTEEASEFLGSLNAPLKLAVMGEFNAGKSTLVNALLGVSQAKVGVVPTTAKVAAVPVEGFLNAGEVVLLDTPGTNATDAGHQAEARLALRQADVVLWVMDATQAGKKTEAERIEVLRTRGALVIPVLNKKDRLSGSQLAEVMAALSGPPLQLPRVWPIAARQGFAARLAGDKEAAASSGLTALSDHVRHELVAKRTLLRERRNAVRCRELVARAKGILSRKVHALEAELASVAEARERLAELAHPFTRAVDVTVSELWTVHREWMVVLAEELRWFASVATTSRNKLREHRAVILPVLESWLEQRSVRQSRRIAEAWLSTLQPVADAPLDIDDLSHRLRAPLARWVGFESAIVWSGMSDWFANGLDPSGPEDGLVEELKEGRRNALRSGLSTAQPHEPLDDLTRALRDVAAGVVRRLEHAHEARHARTEAALRSLQAGGARCLAQVERALPVRV